jgi:hypothetical protein
MNIHTSYTFGPQKSNHFTLLFFGTYGKLNAHVYAISNERKLNDEGQISNYNNTEFCAYSYMNIQQ